MTGPRGQNDGIHARLRQQGQDPALTPFFLMPTLRPMFTFQLLSGDGGFDPLVLLLLAMALDSYIGDGGVLFRRIPHPVRLIGAVIGFFDKKLNRDHRSQMDRAFRGALVVLFMVSAAITLGLGIQWVSFHHDFGWIVEMVLLVSLLSVRELYDRVRAVMTALKNEGTEAARTAVSHVVGRDPAYLDDHGVARASIESLAENFSDGVVAPVFWYVLFGFPGLLVYKTVNTMDSMIGYKTARHLAFGMTAARLDDILNLIPARLSALFIALAALVTPKANIARAVATMWRDAGKHTSMNAGWPEAAMAGALGLALAGPRRYGQAVVDAPWLGAGRAQATTGDMRAALYLYVIANLVNGVWVAALATVRLS